MDDTVDGRNPAPPRMVIIPLFIGFIGYRVLTIPGGAGFRPSTVVLPYIWLMIMVNVEIYTLYN